MVASQRGFTMIELMIAVAVLAVFSSVALSLGVQARREHRMVHGYQCDVLQCREALRSIERDLRSARQVAKVDDEFVLTVGDQQIVYRVCGGELQVQRERALRVLAHCVASMEVSVQDELVTVVLELRPRADLGPRRHARVSTCVAMRNAGGKR